MKHKKPMNHSTLFRDRKEKLLQSIADEYKATIDWLTNRFGLTVYPVHGTLLGIIRTGDFIPHDCDVDSAYMSIHSNPKKVRREWGGIVSDLKRSGHIIGWMMAGHMWIWSVNKKYNFGIWTSWIEEDKYYCVRQYTGQLDKSDILPFGEMPLRGNRLPVPRDSAKMLRLTYGEKWKVSIDYYSKHKGNYVAGLKEVIKDGGLGVQGPYFRKLLGYVKKCRI